MDRIDDGKHLAEGSQVVKCDICGQVLNRSYVKAHKRLSHKTGHSTSLVGDKASVVDVVVELYQQASAKARKEILRRLTSLSDSVLPHKKVR